MVATKLAARSKAENGISEALAYFEGDRKGFRVIDVEVPQVDVKVIRKNVNMTQAEFSSEFGIPLATLKNWEQGHRQPEGATRLFFKLIEQDPGEMKKRIGRILSRA